MLACCASGAATRDLADLAIGLVDLADEHEFRIWTAAGTVCSGRPRSSSAGSTKAWANPGGIDHYTDLRSPPVFWPFLLFVQARPTSAGRPADGLRLLDDSLNILGPSGASLLPELHVLRGDLLRALATDEAQGAAEAEHWYQLALDRATEIGTLMAGLRASTRLARLRLAGGDGAAAERVLAPILAAFTEGFDTPDLRDARDVLEMASR